MMVTLWGMVVMVTVMVTAARGDLQDSVKKQQLRDTLMTGYSKHTLPPAPTVVKLMKFNIQDLEMLEQSHRLNLHAWLGFEWYDERLTWKKEEYEGLKMLSFPSDQLWFPDLTLYNTGDPETALVSSKMKILLYPEGRLLFVPAVMMHLTCVLDITYWPHDSHTCSIKIGSWVHSGNEVDLNVTLTPEIDIQTHENGEITSSEWAVRDVQVKRESKTYACCEEEYVNALINLVLERNAPAYAWLVKAPVVCLALLTLVLFLLPPDAGEKLTVGGICLVLDLIFLVFTSITVSHAPSHTPLIVQLVVSQLVVALVCVLVATCVVRAARGPHNSPPPSMFFHPALNLAHVLCLSGYVKQATRQGRLEGAKSDEVELGVEGGRRSQMGEAEAHWFLVAAVLDRLALIVYLGITVVILIRFSSVV